MLGSTYIEDKAIFVWLQLPGQEEPRAYVIAWSRRLAEQLSKARQRGEERGEAVRMRKPFEATRDESEPTFFAEPQHALPEKAVAEEGPVIYQRPENN